MSAGNMEHLLAELKSVPELNGIADVKAFFAAKAAQIRKINRWIVIVALVVGISYLAFQDLPTIIAISVLLAGGLIVLVRANRREADQFILDDETAAELLQAWRKQDIDPKQPSELD